MNKLFSGYKKYVTFKPAIAKKDKWAVIKSKQTLL